MTQLNLAENLKNTHRNVLDFPGSQFKLLKFIISPVYFASELSSFQ